MKMVEVSGGGSRVGMLRPIRGVMHSTRSVTCTRTRDGDLRIEKVLSLITISVFGSLIILLLFRFAALV